MQKLGLIQYVQAYPIAGEGFAIARGSYTQANAVHAGLRMNDAYGYGATITVSRYGESLESVSAEIARAAPKLESNITIAELQELLPAGGARNALDCALWDLRAKQAGKRVWEMLNLPAPKAVRVSHTTISLDTVDKMAERARGMTGQLKLKLGGTLADDIERLHAVAAAAPGATLIIDANEGWSVETLKAMLPEIARVNVIALEQPLPAAQDEALLDIHAACPIYADEAMHTRADLPRIAARYQGINIKLPKTGGLTEALALKDSAKRMGLKIMVGCMVEPSLASAPAFLVAQGAEIADLDGARLLGADSTPSLVFENDMLLPYGADVWG
ncbi:MAG: dipeptide epimerase [Bdellovibrionales bacterium]